MGGKILLYFELLKLKKKLNNTSSIFDYVDYVFHFSKHSQKCSIYSRKT